MPSFLDGVVTPEAYERWLSKRAIAHVNRDRKRGRSAATRVLYKEAIHAAVILSEGKDAYTGEQLHWHLISKYKNEDSQAGRHKYKAGFALLPTVDHVTAEATEANFRICAWRTNDAKNDLSLEAFLELCVKVLQYAGYSVRKPG
jgi:diadenosine tetraphosphate (Ap4A) HIT family hydrolase